jgi:hypothetical protein
MDDVMADAESERIRRGCPPDDALDDSFFANLAVMPGCQEVEGRNGSGGGAPVPAVVA